MIQVILCVCVCVCVCVFVCVCVCVYTRRLGDHWSNKAYMSEKNEGDNVDNEEAYVAKNIGQPRLFMTLQGQRLKLHYDIRE